MILEKGFSTMRTEGGKSTRGHVNASREQAFFLQGSNCFCYVSTKEISVVGENGVFMRSVQKKKKQDQKML